MSNVYDTTDPKKLLQLKRLEADALLDVLRTINHAELSIAQLCLIVRNVLRAQLGVRKMAFYYEADERWEKGIQVGFKSLSPDGINQCMQVERISPVSSIDSPACTAMGVEYVVPVTNRGETKAFFLVADFADSEVEAQNDLIFIETLGNILSVAIRNRQLMRDKLRQEYLRRELEVAETIQKQLLLSDFSRFRELDVYGINIPHHGIGGDLFDVVKKGKGNTFVCIADVAGKGIGAAMLMSNLQANLRALTAQYDDLHDIISELNAILYNITSGDKFVTLFLAKIESDEQRLTYVNAGHNFPLFFAESGHRELSSGTIILGVMPEIEVEVEEMTFEKGDMLFMYTDGLVEQSDERGQMMGSEKLLAELLTMEHMSSEGVVNHILGVLNRFSEDVSASDDITMLCVRLL